MTILDALQFLRAALAGGLMVIGLVELLLFVLRRRTTHIIGSAMMFCVASVLTARLFIYGDFPPETSHTATLVVWSGLFTFGVLAVFGLRAVSATKPSPVTWFVGILGTVSAALVWVEGPIIAPGYGEFTEWTGATVTIVKLAPTFPLFVFPFAIALGLDVALVGWRDNFAESRDAWRAVIFSIFLIIAGAFDELIQVAGLYQGTGTIDFGLAIGMLSLLFVFAGYTARAFDTLEHDVEVSTEALANTVDSLRGLISGLPDLVLVVRDGAVEPYNSRARETLGDASLTVHELAANEDAAQSLHDLFTNATADPNFARLEVSTVGGSQFLDLVVVSAEIDGERVVIANGRSTSERDEFERQLRLADRLSSLGTMAAGVAHEINNPIAYIAANLEFCLVELEGDEERQEEVDAIRSAIGGTDRVARIVRDLGTFARFEQSRSDAPGEVGHALEIALGIARSTLRHSVTIDATIPDDLPLVAVDTGQLSQVLLNLMSNAGDAMPPEREIESNHLSIEAEETADSVLIRVRDNGVGMTATQAEKIFDPFFTTKDVGEGTGLGLSICHTIIERIGGSILVDSRVGEGTTFTLEIPATETKRKKVTKTKPQKLAGLRILLVDDDPMVLRSTQRLLGLSYDVQTAASGADAITAMKSGSFDAVICDVMMPDMNGLQLYDWVVENEPLLASRFLYFTGGAIGASLQRALAEAQVPVIAKPLDRDKLDEVLTELKAAS